MAALDSPPIPGLNHPDVTRMQEAMRQRAQKEALQKDEEKRAAAQEQRAAEQQRLSQEAGARAQQQETRMQDEERRKIEEATTARNAQTIAAETPEWAQMDAYRGMPYSEAVKRPEVAQHFGFDTYGVAAAKAADAWNKAQQDVTGDASIGAPALPEPKPGESYHVDAQGRISRTVASKAPTGMSADDISAIADAIESGKQQPSLQGLYKNTAAIRAELARRGYDLSHATQDWQATTRMLASMNGAQQLRVRQATQFTNDSLDIVEDLGRQWAAGGFPAMNKVQLIAAKQGLLGPDAQSLATRLDAQINDMVSELATVYKGGNSSTDQSLRLAAENLKANFSEKTLQDSIQQLRKNLQIRMNSLNNATVAGVSPNQQYTPSGAVGQAATAAAVNEPTATNPKTGERIVFRNGQWQPLR